MPDLINGRTPEEIKRILRWLDYACGSNECEECEYHDICNSRTRIGIERDTLAYIERLEAERDAAIKDIPRACGYCKHYNDPPKIEETKHGMKVSYCEKECRHISGINTGWEWCGLKPPEVDA